jgi:hypothetical protein
LGGKSGFYGQLMRIGFEPEHKATAAGSVRALKVAVRRRCLLRKARIWDHLFNRRRRDRRVPEGKKRRAAKQQQGDHDNQRDGDLPHAPDSQLALPHARCRFGAVPIDDLVARYASTLTAGLEKER